MSHPLRSSPRPPRSKLSSKKSKRSESENAVASKIVILVKGTFVLLLCGSSYLAGILFGHGSLDFTMVQHAPMSVGRMVRGGGETDGTSGKDFGGSINAADCEEAFVNAKVQEELEKHRRALSKDLTSQKRRFPKTMEKIANGVARVKKDDLGEFFDFGNPMDPAKGTGEEDAMIIYQSKSSLPSSDKSLAHSAEYNDGRGIPLTDAQTATENCDSLGVIFMGNPGNTRQCTAIIGNFESYHIQRWMKVDTVKSTPVRADLPLALVSRGYASRGKANFYAPPSDGKFSPVRRHWKALRTFLQNVDSVLVDLEPILKRVARNNVVVVLTCNMGQSALLMNFACSARRRGFDLGNVLVFPTDVETKELAEGLGLATYYDEKVRGLLDLPFIYIVDSSFVIHLRV